MNQHREPLPPIQFGPLRKALLANAEHLVPMWLPGGQFDGPEYRCADLSGGHGHSCSVNVRTGAWADFATGEQGGDLISLYAAIHSLSNAMAAVAVAREEKLEDVAGLVKQASGAAVVPAANPRPAPEPKADKTREQEEWSTLRPVPANAQLPTFSHPHRKLEDLEHKAEYRVGAELHGYVMRYRTSDGGKDTLPHTFCSSARDGSRAWKWKTWNEPRPLYFPGHALPDGRTVILVEGELKADVLQQLLDAVSPGIYCVASWVGGSKAWKKAGWDWLAGATVLLWPDCDAQRERVPKAVQQSVIAQAMEQADQIGGFTENDRENLRKTALGLVQKQMPLLPAHKQPGMGAMLGIGALLQAEHACSVQLLPIPAPGEKDSGWDCKDAINVDGWTGEDVLAFFGRAQALPLVDADVQTDAAAPAEAEKPKKPLDPVGTKSARSFEPLQDDRDWLDPFYDHKKHRWDLRRSLVVAALQNDPKLKGCVAYNELTKSAEVRRAWPWTNARAGELEADSTLLLGQYLNTVYRVGDVSTQNIDDGIETVAYNERFHPVREWLGGLVWDKKPRLNKWLMHVLGESPDSLSGQMAEYLTLVGRYWLLGMVWRVMQPGCKFDYCPVLEGKGGLRKSTMVEVLAVRSEWYSDTKFDLSKGKEAYEQVRGKWLYELGELSSFSKADVNDIKAFISSKKDNYRVAFGKRAQTFERQCVLCGSTNDRKYLRDRTGNRRFWPVPVRHVIKTEWLEQYREQLFAEAYAVYLAGERFTPTEDEEARLFVHMQESRLQESAVDAELFKLLTREPTLDAKLINCDAARVAVNHLIKALNVDIGKATSTLKGQIEGWLESNGWVLLGRRRVQGVLESGVYERPAVWPPVEDESGAADWTQQAERKSADQSGQLPEAEASRSFAAPPLPDGIAGAGHEPWDGDDEPF